MLCCVTDTSPVPCTTPEFRSLDALQVPKLVPASALTLLSDCLGRSHREVRPEQPYSPDEVPAEIWFCTEQKGQFLGNVLCY